MEQYIIKLPYRNLFSLAKKCEGWKSFFNTDDMKSILKDVQRNVFKKDDVIIYPPYPLIFNVFGLCPVNQIKVCVISLDPYINEGEAMGISFSVPEGISIPPSLKNIYKELKNDGFTIEDENQGDLSKWVKQGVFLINSALTVEAGKTKSHLKYWSVFTEYLMKYLNNQGKLVIIMWGRDAQFFSKYFDDKKHKKIMSPHPSPFSAHTGFFGSKPFSRANEYLIELKKEVIDWNL